MSNDLVLDRKEAALLIHDLCDQLVSRDELAHMEEADRVMFKLGATTLASYFVERISDYA